MRRMILAAMTVVWAASPGIAAYGADEEVALGQRFRLEKGKSVRIVGVDRELVVVGRDFTVIPSRGIAGGLFVLYDVTYGDRIIKHDGRRRILLSEIPYDFIVERSDYRTYAEM